MNILPCRKLYCCVTTCPDQTPSGLFGHILPEIGKSEHLLGVNVEFSSILGPLIVEIHDLSTGLYVSNGLILYEKIMKHNE